MARRQPRIFKGGKAVPTSERRSSALNPRSEKAGLEGPSADRRRREGSES